MILRSARPGILILGLLTLLSWHGGLHAWQIATATLGIAVLWGSMDQAWRLSWPAVGLGLALLLWQISVSIQPQQSVNGLFWGFCLVLLGFCAAQLGRDSRQRDLLFFLALSVLACAALFFSRNWILLTNPQKHWVGTELVAVATHAFFPNQNLLVVSLFIPGLLLSLAWVQARGLSWLAVLSFVFLGLGIGYAGSRGGLVALAGAATWWLARSWKASPRSSRWLLGAVALVAVLGLAWKLPGAGLQRRAEANAAPQTVDSFRYQRLIFWRASLLASAQRPWWGWGQATFAEAIQRQDVGGELSERNPIGRYRLRLEHAHNDALETAVEWGWPTAILAIGLVLFFFWSRWACFEADPFAWAVEAFLIGLAVHSLFDMPLRPPFIQSEAVLALAWLYPMEKKAFQGSLGATWVALVVAILLSVGAWMEVGLAKAPNSAAPWRWKMASCLQPLDAGFAATGLRAGEDLRWPWTEFCGRQDFTWQVIAGSGGASHDPRIVLQWMKACLALHPYDAPRWLMLSRLAEMTGDAALAEQSLHRALELEPNFVAAWELQADRSARAGDQEGVKATEAVLARINALEVPLDQRTDPYVATLRRSSKKGSP